MKEIWETIVTRLNANEAVVLVTIMAAHGSSPRKAGASMVVCQDGSAVGTIGGGAAEYAAKKHALSLFTERRSDVCRYELRPNDAADLGMVCGGRIRALFRLLEPTDETLQTARAVWNAVCAFRAIMLVTEIIGNAPQNTWIDPRGCAYDAPQIGVDEEDVTHEFFFEPIEPRVRAYVFGGGHVAQALVPLLAAIDFRVTVFEDREEFADPALFPAAETVKTSFDEAFSALHVEPSDFVVVMTRGHLSDYTVLKQALLSPAGYIGCIGSRQKVEHTRQSLLSEGFAPENIARTHSPIGLKIKAETPSEIAVSIAAEMILCRAEMRNDKTE